MEPSKCTQETQQSISDALADESEAPGDQGHPKELIPFINKAGTSVAWGPVVQPKCQPGWPLKWGQSFTASAAEFSIMPLCRMSQNLPSSTAFLLCPLVFLLLCSLHCSVPAAAPSLFQVARSVTGQARSVCVCVSGAGQKNLLKPQLLLSLWFPQNANQIQLSHRGWSKVYIRLGAINVLWQGGERQPVFYMGESQMIIF